jgi:hypothetical protein
MATLLADPATFGAAIPDTNYWTKVSRLLNRNLFYSTANPDYAAPDNGTNDAGPTLQGLVNDAAAAGQPALLTDPAVAYLIGTPVTVPVGTGFMLLGQGWGTVLKAAAGLADYPLKFSTTGGNVTGAVLANFKVDCNGGSGGAGAGSGGIYAKGAVQCLFDHLWITNAYDAGLWLHEIASGNVGHHNRVRACLFDKTVTVAGNGQGVRMQASDENWLQACDFESLGGSGSEPYAVKDWSGINFIDHCNFVGGEEAIRCQNISGTRITQCMFDGVGRDAIHISGSGCTVLGGTFSGGGQSTAGSYSHVVIDSGSGNTVTGGTHSTDATAGRLRSFFREIGTATANVVGAKTFTVSGSLGTGKVELASGSTTRIFQVAGYNPVGNVTAPAVPASTVTATNTTGVDCTVFIVGGTISAISVGGVTTGLTATPATVRLPVGQTIAVTYTVAPTWKWFGD